MDFKAKLPKRLEETVRLLAHGYSIADIAEEECLSKGTIRNRIATAKEIIGCTRETQLCAWFYYTHSNAPSLDISPKVRRIGAFIACLLFVFGTFCTDAQRVRGRRSRRRDETECINVLC